MLGYNELYETLRKEKYSENLQELPKKFLEDYKEYLNQQKELANTDSELFSDSLAKSRKQLENAHAIFRELMLKRKRKILNLVFVATETGIMKKDYENMLSHEKEVFDTMVKTFETSDKQLAQTLISNAAQKQDKNKLILFNQDVDQFLGHDGKFIGPFKSGTLANLNTTITEILVGDKKAEYIDQDKE